MYVKKGNFVKIANASSAFLSYLLKKYIKLYLTFVYHNKFIINEKLLFAIFLFMYETGTLQTTLVNVAIKPRFLYMLYITHKQRFLPHNLYK